MSGVGFSGVRSSGVGSSGVDSLGTAAEVVTFGEPMTLLLASDDVPLSEATRFDSSLAGAESNVAIGLARLGHRVAYFSRVGEDVSGTRVRRVLAAEGVDISNIGTDPTRPTGLMLRDTPVGFPISVAYHRAGSAATALSPADVPVEVIRSARLLHVTGITAALSATAAAACELAMRTAREAGVAVSFDPNVRLRLASAERWQEIGDQLGRLADVVFTGAEESATVAPGVDPVDFYRECGASTVVVKDGANGATEHTLSGPQAGTSLHGPARSVRLVDPVGAGDAFNVGWLSAWLRGADAADRLAEAALIASLVVTVRGDITGLPSRATVDHLLASGSDVVR